MLTTAIAIADDKLYTRWKNLFSCGTQFLVCAFAVRVDSCDRVVLLPGRDTGFNSFVQYNQIDDL